MGKYYESKSFKKLQDTWYKKLKKKSKGQEGFVDQEDSKENLKQYDRRTIAFENRERICEFFLKVDSYLTTKPNIPTKHIYALELWSKGTRVSGPKGIANKVKLSRRQVFYILKKYRDIINK